MNGEQEYLMILREVLDRGERKENRTGIDTLAIPPVTLTHDMSLGFPLLTTKKVPFHLIASELEFFIQGLTDKRWLQERANTIWNEWASPPLVDAYLKQHPDADRKEVQKQIPELGPVYGRQWRAFNDGVTVRDGRVHYDFDAGDQLRTIVEKLKTNPNDRRMVCSAWNPLQLHEMALPACHVMWVVNHINGVLHLHWTQRSCDLFLGVPFNLASYALLLHLLCKESGFVPGQVSGTLVDCHIYVDHLEQVKEQLNRRPYALPTIETPEFKSIFNWEPASTLLQNYQSHPAIKASVAV